MWGWAMKESRVFIASMFLNGRVFLNKLSWWLYERWPGNKEDSQETWQSSRLGALTACIWDDPNNEELVNPWEIWNEEMTGLGIRLDAENQGAGELIQEFPATNCLLSSPSFPIPKQPSSLSWELARVTKYGEWEECSSLQMSLCLHGRARWQSHRYREVGAYLLLKKELQRLKEWFAFLQFKRDPVRREPREAEGKLEHWPGWAMALRLLHPGLGRALCLLEEWFNMLYLAPERTWRAVRSYSVVTWGLWELPPRAEECLRE